jgi:beta-glucosidase-like glycosyl hydrolase
MMYDYVVFIVILTACFSVTNSASIQTEPYAIINGATRTWDEAIALSKRFAAQMTLEEKCNMTEGVASHCTGFVSPVPHLNFSGLCFQASQSGVGDSAQFSTAFVGGIHIAATWDRDLFYQRAAAIGQEFRGKGIHFDLGPMMNINRNALHGRNWEGFGADPYLSGENAYYYVQGVQNQGVVTTAKHYICNEQESNRTYQPKTGPTQGYSANLDDKTMHEIYLWPFAESVAAGVGSIMCSYNQVNGTQACQNSQILNELLKGELQFQGHVMSDWGATKVGLASALGGLDMNMPGQDGLMGYALLQDVKNGSITEARINDMVIRIMAPYFLLAQDQDYPSVNLNYDATGDHYLLNRHIGTAGIILLKNINNTLPLNTNTDKFYSIYGSAASRYSDGVDPHGLDGLDGALYQGGGSGYVRPTYVIDPLSALLAQARDFHLQIQYIVDQDDYVAINRSLENSGFLGGKCLVFINAWSSEGRDRHNLFAYHDGDKLVNTVAAHCASTIVIVNSVSQLNLEAWIDNPHVSAVIWSGLPGPEYGPAIVDVLFGNYNPGGKLVFTIAKNDSDYGTNITNTYNSNYTEGVFLDYRHFDNKNITPRYYFGYGLSYTTFYFSKLMISKVSQGNHIEQSLYRRRRVSSYNNKALLRFYELVYTISFTITNIGSVDGSEVPQLYLGFPEEAAEPPKILRGFERVYLEVGETKTVTLALTKRDISYWNTVYQKWTVAPGEYTVWIATSANNADIKLEGFFHI